MHCHFPPFAPPLSTPRQLLPSLARRLRDPNGVALEMLALEVAALAKVDRSATKVIVMDGQVGGSKNGVILVV